MLELIFQGFMEWIYGLLVEMWEFIADGLLDIMSLDFDYLQTHAPIVGQMEQALLAAGWALLLGNLVFQALKSMAVGLGFEGEDPKLLFSRTFVFAFLLLASPQICRIGLDLTSNVMALLSVPDTTNVGLVDEGVFGTLTAAWLMAIICSLIVMFKVLKLVIEVAERYVILFMLTICAPLAFAMGGSKNTASIFSGWCRMFGSMCLLMVTNLVCCKILFSVVSTVPSGLDVLPWMVLIFAIVKVAHKSDAIITRIGLNPAITGGPGRTLPGMLAYTVISTAASLVAKGVGGSGGGRTTQTASAGPKASGPSGTTWSRFSSPNYGSRNTSQQYADNQSATQQANTQQNTSQQNADNHSSAQQNNTRQERTSHANAQQPANGGTTFNSSGQAVRGGGRYSQSRRSSVPPGTRRSPGYVSLGGAPGASGVPGQGGASVPNQPNRSRPGQAGTSSASTPRGGGRYGPAGTTTAPTAGTSGTSTTRPSQTGTASTSTPRGGGRYDPAGNPSRTAPPKQTGSAQPGAAGTVGGASSARSTHSTAQTVGGSTVHNSSQASARTNVTVGRGSPTAKAPPTAAPRPPQPGGPNTSGISTSKPSKARSTRREKTGAALKTPVSPTPGAVQSGLAGKPSRSTQRPADSVPRPGRNAPASTAAPTTGSTRSNPAPQERTSNHSRATAEPTSASTARQEPWKSPASAAPTVKGGAPSIRPGGAGTAPAGKRASSPSRTATHQTKRVNPARRPPPHSKRGTGHG